MINRDNKPWAPCTVADIAWTDDGTPRSRAYGDVYYTPDNGLAESRYVFLEGNQLRQRMTRSESRVFHIGELGFGTGLNFLLTWALFRRCAPPQARLHYWSCELHPLRADDLQRALLAWPAHAEIGAALQAVYPLPVPGQHRCLLDNGRVTLDLCWEEAGSALADLAENAEGCIDAWYLDGFSPADNTGMWRDELWHSMALASRDGATFATFTAAGAVRRGLQAAGFAVGKRPGFGRKRESLHGMLEAPPARHEHRITPWDRPARAESSATGALVIGAGLAGCMTAAALARRGLQVTLMDRAAVASRGSGNAQGVIYTRLSHRHSALNDVSLLSYLFALRAYSQLFDAGALTEGYDGELCGCLQMAGDPSRHAALRPALASLPELAELVDRDTAAARCGLTPAAGGLWFPGSGWMDPRAVCAAVIRHHAITVIEDCGKIDLQQLSGQWVAIPERGDSRRAQIAVVSAGVRSASLAGLDWLPLRPVRGQTTTLPAQLLPATPRGAFCHSGYLAPPRAGAYCLGATFSPGDTDTTLREADHRDNLDALAGAVPAWAGALAASDVHALTGRAEVRCASPDDLPMVGRAPVVAEWSRRYAELAANARRVIPQAGDYRDGLFVNTAHGSRGLTTTPLAAELVASLACGEALPVNRRLTRALAPARFIIRDIVRSGRRS